jgi:nitrate/nitrite transporter NarK
MALGMVAGAFIYGPLDQLFNTRKWVGVVGNSIGVAVLILLALWTVNDLATTKICLVLIGVTGGAYGLLMAHARAFFPPELVGRGVTLMNFFAIGGIGLLQFGSGALVTTKADPTDPVAGFSALFMFYAVLLGLSIVIYLFSKDAPPAKSI